MAEESVSGVWTTPLVQFQVKWGNHEMTFKEVTGLNTETQIIEYRGGNNKAFAPVKMPGIQKYGNVTLKKGIFTGDAELWRQFISDKNPGNVSAVVINLIDESGAVVMSWNLTKAFPSKITVTEMNANANEIAIESIEIAHEGLTLAG